VRFVWNLGAGSTPIEYPLEIELAVGKEHERDKWYRVVAERFLFFEMLKNVKATRDAAGEMLSECIFIASILYWSCQIMLIS